MSHVCHCTSFKQIHTLIVALNVQQEFLHEQWCQLEGSDSRSMTFRQLT